MQVTETNALGLKRELQVIVSKDDLDKRVTSRLDELRSQVRLPGFRPGKVPPGLLRKRYGSAVLGEVLEQAVQVGSQEAIARQSLRPAMQPKVEIASFSEGADLVFNLTLEVLPEFEPIDFSGISLERLKVAVPETEITEALERLAKQQGQPAPLKEPRPTRPGDVVVIDFVGRADGEEFAGGKAEDFHLELGSGSFIPGFEDQLVGVSAGDTVVVKVRFPDQYGNKALAGKDAEFEVKIKEVREIEPAAIDESLAKAMGQADLEALKQSLRESYEREYAGVSRMRLKRALLDVLADSHSFPVPEGMVEMEFKAIWQALQEDIARDPESEDAKRSEEELKAEYRPIAERRVRLGLLLAEVGRRNNVQVSQEDVNRALIAEARRFPGQEQRVVDYYRNHPEAMDTLRGPIFEDKVVDFILELAKLTERTVSAEELLADPEEESAAEKPKKEAKPKKKKAAAPEAETVTEAVTEAQTKVGTEASAEGGTEGGTEAAPAPESGAKPAPKKKAAPKKAPEATTEE